MSTWNEEKIQFQNSKTTDHDNHSTSKSGLKQLTVVYSFNKKLSKSKEKLNQNEDNHLILNFIVEEMLPLSIVEKESFKIMAERFLSVKSYL